MTSIKNPADLPMNPHVIQAWQSMHQGGDSPFGDMGGMDEGGGDFGEEGADDTDAEDNGNKADGEAWGELENRQKEGGATVEKSLAKRRVVRIVV